MQEKKGIVQDNDPLSNYHQESVVPDSTRRILRGPLAPVNNFLNLLEWNIKDFFQAQKTIVKTTVGVILVIVYIVYFAFALSIDAERAADLIYITVFASFCFVYWLVKKLFGRQIWKRVLKPMSFAIDSRKTAIRWYSIACIRKVKVHSTLGLG